MTSKLETKGVRVFLGNIPFEATTEEMYNICSLAGRVIEFRFVMEQKRVRQNQNNQQNDKGKGKKGKKGKKFQRYDQDQDPSEVTIVSRHKGTGFCEYPDVDTAQSAIRNLNRYPIRGRELICDWADNEVYYVD